MKLYLFPAGRAVSVLSLKNYLEIDCDIERLDFTRGDQRSAHYAKLNPNMKMPTLEDDGFVLWESNAILFYLAAKHPAKGLWPSDVKGQADVCAGSHGRMPTGMPSPSAWCLSRKVRKS
ncbi:MAG: glutathione S-transferase [Methylobacteriaceae bacterium]|nr:glutathione S-transferase [Methylobacteriaceae bacterium]